MANTPDYIKKAVNKYRKKFDIIQIRFPKGTRERLKEKGNTNDYILDLVLSDLEESKEQIPGSEEEPEENIQCPF